MTLTETIIYNVLKGLTKLTNSAVRFVVALTLILMASDYGVLPQPVIIESFFGIGLLFYVVQPCFSVRDELYNWKRAIGRKDRQRAREVRKAERVLRASEKKAQKATKATKGKSK